MSNGIDFTEKDVIKLLTAMGVDKKPYPENLFAGRRAAYVSQVTALVGIGLHTRNGGKQIQGGSTSGTVPMTPLMKVVLTALIAGNIALAAYLGVSVYENWDKVEAWLSGEAPVSETLPAPLGLSTEAPAISTEIVVSPEETIVPVSTPEPNNLSGDSQPSENDSSTNPEVSTPDPNKPGLHLGQTPHGPDEPPSSNNEDNSQNNNQGNQDKNKEKQK